MFLPIFTTFVLFSLPDTDILSEVHSTVFGEEKLFWINLKRRPDRRKAMEALLGNKGTRIEGVDGRSISQNRGTASVTGVQYNEKGTTIIHDGNGNLKEFRDTLGQGAVGCALSHRKAWRAIITSGAPLAVILEDDLTWMNPVVVSPLLFSKLRSLDTPWDVIFLSYHGCHTASTPLPITPLTQPLHRANNTWYSGLFTYALHGPSSAAKLLQNWPLTHQIDKHLAYQCLGGDLVCYRVPVGDCPTNTTLSEETLDSDVQIFELQKKPQQEEL